MNAPARFAVDQYLACLNTDACVTPEAHALREEALRELPDMLVSCDLDGLALDHVCAAYFACTYGISPDRHAIKRSINNVLRENLRSAGILDADVAPLAPRFRGDRPSCVVVTNHFRSSHVMFRAFAKSLYELRAHFTVTNVCLGDTDHSAAQIFDAVKVAQFTGDNYLAVIARLRELVLSLAPQVIVFADIAMHPFSVFLSNLRLAPLQVVLSGHPAPSQSKQIDAFVLDDSFAGKTPDYDEPVAFFPRRDWAIYANGIKPLAPRSSDGKTRIVVPITIPKMNYPFIKVLHEIREETGAEIHVTSNGTPEETPRLAAEIHRTAPGLVVHPNMDYSQFLALIASCDMFLASFPFSGYNSIHDCLSQGLPGVVMEGADVASHQAASMIHSIELDTYGAHFADVCETRAAYVALACDLARSPYLRATMRENLLAAFREPEKLSLFAPRAPGVAGIVRELWERLL